MEEDLEHELLVAQKRQRNIKVAMQQQEEEHLARMAQMRSDLAELEREELQLKERQKPQATRGSTGARRMHGWSDPESDDSRTHSSLESSPPGTPVSSRLNGKMHSDMGTPSRRPGPRITSPEQPAVGGQRPPGFGEHRMRPEADVKLSGGRPSSVDGGSQDGQAARQLRSRGVGRQSLPQAERSARRERVRAPIELYAPRARRGVDNGATLHQEDTPPVTRPREADTNGSAPQPHGPPGFARPVHTPQAQGGAEDRGIAGMRDRDILLALKDRPRRSLPSPDPSPQSNQLARKQSVEDQIAAQGDLRDVLNRRRVASNASSTPAADSGTRLHPEEVNPICGDGSWPAAEAPARAAAHPEFRSAGRDARDEQSMLQAQRGEINVQMDSIAHNGSPIVHGGEDGTDAVTPKVNGAQPARKAREWDLDKTADPQKDMFAQGAGGSKPWVTRVHTSGDWGDEPMSPAVGDAGEDRREAYGGGPRRNEDGRQAWGAGSDAPGSGRGQDAQGGMGRRYEDGEWGDSKREEYIRTMRGNADEQFPGLQFGRSKPQAQKQDWMDDPTRLEEAFPSLGGAPAATASGAWGSGNAKARITEAVAAALPAKQAVSVEQFEIECGLRDPAEQLSETQLRQKMRSKRDFEFYEPIRGRDVNTVQGLELHDPVLSPREQVRLEKTITEWVRQGMLGNLRGRTFSAPRKWAKGKGRITVQFGYCYNYAVDNRQRPPGIIPEEVVEPMPPVLVALVQRLLRWKVLPRSEAPDSAIVNIYEPEDCIPPHIDHHDFSRPFCTISLLSEEEIMFGSRLVPNGPGDFSGVKGHTLISLPVGSCLVLKGNGADVAMHCIPPVRHRRMSITLRKMGRTHADKVNAEAAKKLAGIPSALSGGDGGSGAPPSGAPPSRTLNLGDLVTTKSRGSLAHDQRPDRRWADEEAEDDNERGRQQSGRW